MKPVHVSLSWALRTATWIRYGQQFESPVRPDRVIWIDPGKVTRKPLNPPGDRRFPPPAVVGGDWDTELELISDDIVFETFRRRFVDGDPWDETGYIEFLRGDESEHGNLTREEAISRCTRIDRLYEYLRTEGYKTQSQLEREGNLIDELTPQLRPPAYREVTVDVARDGEMVWRGGIHRLVISKLLDIDEIPVRINTRHNLWQKRRDCIYTTGELDQYHDHPDIEYLLK